MLYKIVGVGLAGVVLNIILKQYKPEFALLSNVCCSVVLVLMMLNSVSELLNEFLNISSFISVQDKILVPVLKVIGIGYLTEFSSDLAEDVGNKSIANKILIGGKVAICVISLPVLKDLINAILSII